MGKIKTYLRVYLQTRHCKDCKEAMLQFDVVDSTRDEKKYAADLTNSFILTPDYNAHGVVTNWHLQKTTQVMIDNLQTTFARKPIDFSRRKRIKVLKKH